MEIIKIDSYQCVTDKSFRDDINSRNNTEELEFEGIIDCLGDKASFQYSYFAGNENCTDGYVVQSISVKIKTKQSKSGFLKRYMILS